MIGQNLRRIFVEYPTKGSPIYEPSDDSMFKKCTIIYHYTA